jgi:hypothetical protein
MPSLAILPVSRDAKRSSTSGLDLLALCFGQRPLHVILRYLVFYRWQVTRLGSFSVFCGTQTFPLAACYSPQALHSLVGPYTPTDKCDTLSKLSAGLTHTPSFTEYRHGHTITRTVKKSRAMHGKRCKHSDATCPSKAPF